MSIEPRRILLAERNSQHAKIIEQNLKQSGGPNLEVHWRDHLATALEFQEATPADVILMNLRLLDAEGLPAVEAMVAQAYEAPVIVISSTPEPEIVTQTILAGAQDFLNKTKLSSASLWQAIRMALDRKSAEKLRYYEDGGSAESSNSGSDAGYRGDDPSIRAIINTSMDCIITMDQHGKILHLNPAAIKTFGYKTKEVIGKEMGELFMPPHVRDRQRRSFQLYQASGTGSMLGQRVEVPAFRKDGSEFIAEMATQPVNIGGELVFTVFLRDITVRKHAEQALKKEVDQRRKAEEALWRERDLLRTIIDHLPDFIFAKDAQGRFMTANHDLLLALGLDSSKAIVGKTDHDFHDQNSADQYHQDDLRVMQSGQPLINREERHEDHAGRVRWVLTTKVPLLNEAGDVQGLVGICRDITERKRVEQELLQAKQAAEVASRAKSDFLANMSHEIRTPMNAVIGITELLLDTKLTDPQRDYLGMVHESGEALLGIINDILDFSKIEAGKLEFEQEEFHLRNALSTTLKTLANRANNKQIELACHYDPTLPNVFIGDVNRLRQIIINLVGNAIKFTEQGEVVLDIGFDTKTAEEVVLHFAVRDTGIGIPPEKLEHIFRAFEQADATVTRRFGGTGLGLAISSRLIELMGGKIWVESKVGHGSVFHFVAKFKIGDNLEKPLEIPVALPGTRVLIVDDNRTNRFILQEMMQNWKMIPTNVSSAREALATLEQAQQSGEPFQLLASDLNMPEMDGLSLADTIRHTEALAKLPILILTSGDRPGDLARGEALGISAHLMKPVNQAELFDAIVVALQNSTMRQTTQTTSENKSPPLRSLRILLAEDSLVNQKLAIGLLQREGHQVTVAVNGALAVAAYETGAFDVVLMDVQMPEMDGLEATRRIRLLEQSSGSHIPIVAITAHAMTGDRERCLEAGMDEYITKPIHLKTITEMLQRLCGVTHEASEQATPATVVTNAEHEGIDWKVALKATGGDETLLKDLVDAFLAESPQTLQLIHQAIHQSDAATLHCEAHKLKGAMRLFGVGSAYDVAFQLEMIGKSGHFTEASALAAKLSEQVQAIHTQLFQSAGSGAS